jgi:hypothetical protein
MYGHTLEDDLKKQVSGNFLEASLALLTVADEYEAHCVRNALKGFTTNDKVVIQALCTKDTDEIIQLRETYNRCNSPTVYFEFLEFLELYLIFFFFLIN